MKSIFFFISFIFLISFISAGCTELSNGYCNPSSGYDYCAETSWNCDGAISHAKVQISSIQVDGEQHGTYATGDTYINFNFVGDYGYFNENINSNNWWESNCNDYGCSGSDMFGANGIKLTNNPGDHYTDCPIFYAFDRADYNGYYSSSISPFIGWIGNGDCLDIKQVECYDDSDCSGNLVCDKSGSWQTWNCVESSCVEDWECSYWSSCSNGIKTRVCEDRNNCGTIVNRPILTQSCDEQAPCPQNNLLYYDPSYSTEVIDCIVWQYEEELINCGSGGWYVYHHEAPEISNLYLTDEEYQSLVPSSCFEEPEPEVENIWEKVWFTQFGIDFTIPVLLTSFGILVFVLKLLRKR